MTSKDTKILIVVDYQNDFVDPKGSLYVPEAETLSVALQSVIESSKYKKVIFTKDWHIADHISFARVCNVEPFSACGNDMKWPDHCVQDTKGSELFFDDSLYKSDNRYAFIEKGQYTECYSGFTEELKTMLENETKLLTLYICGVALDYCVYHTLKDALENGYKCVLLTHLTKSIDNRNGTKLIAELRNRFPELLVEE